MQVKKAVTDLPLNNFTDFQQLQQLLTTSTTSTTFNNFNNFQLEEGCDRPTSCMASSAPFRRSPSRSSLTEMVPLWSLSMAWNICCMPSSSASGSRVAKICDVQFCCSVCSVFFCFFLFCLVLFDFFSVSVPFCLIFCFDCFCSVLFCFVWPYNYKIKCAIEWATCH